MILASVGDLAFITAVIVIANAITGLVIGRHLSRISNVLESRHAIVVPEELDPDDHIVIWHKDDSPPDEAMPPDPEPDKPRKPIVGLE